MDKVKMLGKKLLQDESGAVISGEALILLIGTAVVSSAVVVALTTVLTGDGGNTSATGGVAGTVTEAVNDVVSTTANEVTGGTNP